jgi:hypothetical protein
MSTKFNRNDAQAGNDNFYHEDYKTDLNGVEQDNLATVVDFEALPCIIEGLEVSTPTYPEATTPISAGKARDKDGKPIIVAEVDSVELLNTSGGNNYIILAHKYSTDTLRKAYSSGVEYDTRKYDDFELSVADTKQAGDIILANIKKVGGVWLKYDSERTHPVYRPTSGDITPPTDPSTLLLTTGIMGDTALPIYTNDFLKRVTPLAWLKAAWNASSDSGSGLRGYEVFLIPLILINEVDTEQLDKRQEQHVQYSASAIRTDVTFQNLTPGVKYRIKVRAVDMAGNVSGFAALDIIAGGPKQIPESCTDAIENLAVSAQDQGIKIVFDIKTAYQDKVAGTEVVWTDDDSEPDFDNSTMSKLFTDRKTIFLPARFSTDKQKIFVKAKIRLVDKTSRHCTTPFSISATQTKKYIADLSEYMVNVDYLKLAVPEISAANFSWRNLRTVAKAGSQFTTITQAFASITDDQYYVVLVGPGGYSEDVDFKGKNILLVGYGKVMIKGRIQNADFGKHCGLKDLTVYNDNAVADAINIQPNAATAIFVMDNVLVKGDHFTTQGIYVCGKGIIKRSAILTTAAIPGIKFANNAVTGIGSSGHVNSCKISVGNSNCIAFVGLAPLEVSNCLLKSGAYSIAQTGSYAVRVYNCVYQVAPNGTIDYGTASNVSNIINANIEIVPEDDFGSDA